MSWLVHIWNRSFAITYQLSQDALDSHYTHAENERAKKIISEQLVVVLRLQLRYRFFLPPSLAWGEWTVGIFRDALHRAHRVSLGAVALTRFSSMIQMYPKYQPCGDLVAAAYWRVEPASWGHYLHLRDHTVASQGQSTSGPF